MINFKRSKEFSSLLFLIFISSFSSISLCQTTKQGLSSTLESYDSEKQILSTVGKATNPFPENGDWNVSLTPLLKWKTDAQVAAQGYDIYLGTDYQAVAQRQSSVYSGAVDVNNYSPSLKLYTNYYWAVDVTDTGGNLWAGDVWAFKTRHTVNACEGYYMDYFIDGGLGIAEYESLYATEQLGLEGEFVKETTIDGYDSAHYLMSQVSLGQWVDDNGVLLYPDGDARFRVMYVGGGFSMDHCDALLAPEGSLRVDAQDRVREFFAGGGSYVGNCAGAAMAFYSLGSRGSTYFRLFDNFSGSFTNISESSTDFEIPDGITERRGYVLPKSPLLKYYDFGGDFYINNVRQQGGNWCKWWDTSYNWPWDKAQVCAVYNDKIDGVVVRAGYKTTDGASIWAYKRNEESGRICPCGGHPEEAADGEQRDLESAMFAYALDGGGCPVVKSALSNKVTRLMNDNTREGYERIGDRQYHHFVIEVPQGSGQLNIALDGEMYDLNLYAKHGDFAFEGELGVVEAANASGCDESITISNPQPGPWYVAVKCVTVPTKIKLDGYYEYTGNFEVLNGIGYEITAEFETAQGDVDLDGQIDQNDLSIMSENWLADKSHYRQVGELIGHWDFAQQTGTSAMDISGCNNIAYFYGDSQWADGGIELDGDGDYLMTNNSLDKLQLTNSYSISLKLKADGPQLDGTGIICKTSTGQGIPVNYWSLGYGYYEMAGKLVMANGFENWNTGIGSNQVTTGPHHVAIVYGAGRISSYLDGHLIKHEEFEHLPLSGEGVLKIGSDRFGFRCFDGMLDDIMLFDYELKPDEIKQLHDQGFIEGQMVNEDICVVRPEGDLNGDCRVDYADYVQLANNWLSD